MIGIAETLIYYKRTEVREAMLYGTADKEVVPRFGDGGYGKRPDTITMSGDILELVKQGATSFHISPELWSNPLALRVDMTKAEQDELRLNWDVVIDIDCKDLEFSKYIASLVIKAFNENGIKKSLSIKFSGNKGFHIGVPHEAFPVNLYYGADITSFRALFPELTKRIINYLIWYIGTKYIKLIDANNIQVGGKELSLAELSNLTGRPVEELVIKVKDKPPIIVYNKILNLDEQIASPRHLIRMEYSLHEKSGLASVPFNPDKLLLFTREHARPDKIKFTQKFLDRSKADPKEGMIFLSKIFDNKPLRTYEDRYKEQEELDRKKNYTEFVGTSPEASFPPCITTGLKGMEDGKKRFLFILTNFLKSSGWSDEAIDSRVKEWNKINPTPLREQTILQHLRFVKNKKPILPPNCFQVYKELGICFREQDRLCQVVRNPVQYARRKFQQEPEKKKRGRKVKNDTASK